MCSGYALLVIYPVMCRLLKFSLLSFFLFCFFVDFELLGFNTWFEFEIAELVSSVLLRLTTL